ncbi:MAG: 8-oxo-dGTP pyrophosphatase MutT (NUDIX family) [Gammaproteobacteria bacterium]|jgi:8-oxo-dGTP pyrophosphatase MutT (NUDIX family)
MTIAPALPSSSVIMMRERSGSPEILLVKRNSKIVFHGGAWVFPGGKVDPEDASGDTKDDELEIARRAGVREVHEEAGLQIDGASLLPFSHWTTPENQPKRFAAWFFIGLVPYDSQVVVDGSEIVDHRWIGIDEALAQRHRDEIILPPPAYVSLLKIRRFGHSRDVLDYVEDRGAERFCPRIVELDGGRCSLYDEDAGYESLNLDAPGPRHRLRMLKNGWQYIEDY